MKTILWFTNSPCGSVRRTGGKNTMGGWLISLEDEIKKHKDMDLHVCFFSSSEDATFDFEGVTYHPVLIKSSRNPIVKIYKRGIKLEKLDNYLLPKLLDVVKAVHPDLIHIHGTEERFGLIADYVTDIPIVFSIQGLIAPYLEKYFSGMPRDMVGKYEPFSHRLRNISYRNDLKSFEYRAKREIHYLSEAKYIFGRTFWDRDITALLNVNRQYFVVNEILRSPFYDKVWNKSSFSKTLKIVSTISGGIYKGYETLLRTALLLKEHSNVNFEWIVAGYDEHNKWERIARKITGIKPESCNVKLMGRIGADELSDILVSSDIYCHVSHIENSPNSVCEAMAVGMPVIASYSGGTASLLQHEVDGVLVQDGDPYVLAGAIVEMYSDFAKAKTYGISARRKALVRHSPENVYLELLQGYENILRDWKAVNK